MTPRSSPARLHKLDTLKKLRYIHSPWKKCPNKRLSCKRTTYIQSRHYPSHTRLVKDRSQKNPLNSPARQRKNPNNSNMQDSPPEPRRHPPALRSSRRCSRSSLVAGDSAAADSTCPAAAAGNRAADHPAVDDSLAARRKRPVAGDRTVAAGTVRYMDRHFDGRQGGKRAVGRRFVLVLLSFEDGPCAGRRREEARSWLRPCSRWLVGRSRCGVAVARGELALCVGCFAVSVV